MESTEVEQPKTDNQPEEATADLFSVTYDQAWGGSLLRPFLIALMIVCLIVAMLAFLRYAFAGVPILYTGVMIFLGIAGALIGCFSTTLLAQPEQRMRRGTGIRAAEIVILLALVRLASWVSVGNWPSVNAVLTRPIESLLDPPFVLSAVIVGMGWMLASAMTSDFLRMGLQPDELYAAQQRTGRSTDDPTPPNYTDRRAVLAGFTNKWLMGALFMVLMAAGTQLEPAQNGFFALGRQNIDPAVITAVVVYMLTGLVLLSQGQLAVLRARWTLDRVPSTGNILRNWPLYTLLLIVGVGVLATLLPFGDTFYLSIILASIIKYTITSAAFLMQMLVGIFFLIAALFGGEQPEAPPEPPPEQGPLVLPQMEALPEEQGLPPWLGGSIFWVIMALLLGYAAFIYFSGRGGNLHWLRQLWATLRARWAELFGAYQSWQDGRLATGDGEATEKSGRSLLSRLTGRTRWQDLSPDQQARYFYLNMLERAEKAGVGRDAGETPLRYAPRLTQLLHQKDREDAAAKASEVESEIESAGEVVDDSVERDEQVSDDAIHTLTDAFVRTRYAEQPVSATEAGGLKSFWDQIGSRLKRMG